MTFTTMVTRDSALTGHLTGRVARRDRPRTHPSRSAACHERYQRPPDHVSEAPQATPAVSPPGWAPGPAGSAGVSLAAAPATLAQAKRNASARRSARSTLRQRASRMNGKRPAAPARKLPGDTKSFAHLLIEIDAAAKKTSTKRDAGGASLIRFRVAVSQSRLAV
jgi:hypothetical protein